MAMLHIVNKSPFERNALAACLRLAAPGGSVLLIEDGVIAAMKATRVADEVAGAMEKELSFYVLTPDVRARGLAEERLLPGVKAVDYDGFVDLVTGHDNVQSWL